MRENNNIVALIEPTIKVKKLAIPDFESDLDTSGQTPVLSKTFNITPLAVINGYELTPDKLETFEISTTSFIPTCRFSFYDNDLLFTARHFPKDSDVIEVYVRSTGTEKEFKAIRMDFSINSIRPFAGDGVTLYTVEGYANIPGLLKEDVSWFEGTSFDALLEIASNVELGYASNLENTEDAQIWINPCDSAQKFIQDAVSNSYYNDTSFLTAYVDLHYYLTFVEINSILNQKEDNSAISAQLSNPPDTIGLGDEASDFTAPRLITNASEYSNTSFYIEKYTPLTNAGSVNKLTGTKRWAQWWDYTEREFISEWVEQSPKSDEGYISTVSTELPENEQILKYKYLGIQCDNVHTNYLYSNILNHQNTMYISKYGMEVVLSSFNPSLLLYSKVYCHIVEYADQVKRTLTYSETAEDYPADAVRRQDGDNTLDHNTTIVNEMLSGWWLITGIDIIYKKGNVLNQKLYLNRREIKPSV